MRHSDMKMTFRYAHLAPSVKQQAVNLLTEISRDKITSKNFDIIHSINDSLSAWYKIQEVDVKMNTTKPAGGERYMQAWGITNEATKLHTPLNTSTTCSIKPKK